MATTTEAPTSVAVKPVPLSPEQQGWLERAYAQIDEDRMRELNFALTNIHSPTGGEREINEWLVGHMSDMGLDAIYQPLDEHSGNAVGWLRGSGGGPSLLLYAPIDTHLEADPEQDVPWVGPELRPDMLPNAYVAENGDVIGLGSSNPKGMTTLLCEAVSAVIGAEIRLKGDVILAAAGGGMPTNPSKGSGRMNHGLGSGVSYMINHGVAPDFAIICKPGWAVSWEEVGLCWFKVTVKGQMGYAGITRTIPNFRNSIVHASTFVLALEEWLPKYQARNTSGLCSPQGAISAIRGGWPHKPAFPSAAVEVYVDIRCTPRIPPAQVRAQFAEAIQQICVDHPELDLDWEMIAAYPGGSTDPENWIVQSTMRGWEAVEARPHEVRTGASGQTDASAIRNLGIPTARVGFPQVPTTPAAWAGFGGMGVSFIPDLVKVTKAIIYAIVDTCTRTRQETGAN